MRIINGDWLYYHNNSQFIVLKPVHGFMGRKVRGIWNELYSAERAAKTGDIIIQVNTGASWSVGCQCPKITRRM